MIYTYVHTYIQRHCATHLASVRLAQARPNKGIVTCSRLIFQWRVCTIVDNFGDTVSGSKTLSVASGQGLAGSMTVLWPINLWERVSLYGVRV